jgi:hypothetical protein
MAGAVSDCELTGRTRFAVATARDDAAIRHLLRESAMPGRVSVTFEREPDYFRGANIAGGDDQIIVAFAGPDLVCLGRCSRRDCWINGESIRAGYLAELRLAARARGRFTTVRDGYRYFRECENGGAHRVYFTSVAADNTRARRLLERGARGMPAYSFLGELTTLLVVVPRHARPATVRLEPARAHDLPEIVALLNEHGRRYQLATVWNEERVRGLDQHGLPLHRFLLLRDRERVIACGALWDQRSFRQTVIRNYARGLSAIRAIRPLANSVGRFLGIPPLPRPGSALAHAFLSPLAFAQDATDALTDFLSASFPIAAQLGLDFVTLALPSGDARAHAVQRRFSTHAWSSRLCAVTWPDDFRYAFSGTAAFLPDIALL